MGTLFKNTISLGVSKKLYTINKNAMYYKVILQIKLNLEEKKYTVLQLTIFF